MRSPGPNEVSGLRQELKLSMNSVSAWRRSKETIYIAAGPA